MVISLLFWWSPEEQHRRQIHDLQGAIVSLRQSSDMLTTKLKTKELRIKDCDIALAELAFAHKKSQKSLTKIQSMKLRGFLTRKKVLERGYERFNGILTTVITQLDRLEDAPTIIETWHAMKRGTRAHSQIEVTQEYVEQVLEDIQGQQEAAVDIQNLIADKSAVDDALNGLSDADLEEELAALLEDTDFLSQFNKDDLHRAEEITFESLTDERHIEREAEELLF